MHCFLLSILVTFQIHTSAPDNYISYYNLSNEAKQLYEQKDFNGALAKITAAFRCVSYTHNDKILLATEVAVSLKDYALASSYLQQGFAQGIILKTIVEDSVYADFIKTSHFKKLRKKFDVLHAAYLKRLDNEYADAIDSLVYIDQFVLRSSIDKPKRIFDLTKEQSKVMHITDSTVYFSLMSLIEKKGFPTERIVRRESLRGVYLIIHHFVRLPGHEIHLEKMKDFLNEGKFMPFYYAWAYDQCLGIRKQKPFYYCGVPYDEKKLTPDDLKTINLERSKIGLEPLVITDNH